MNNFRSGFGRSLALLIVLFMSASCSHDPLPQVPAFEELGFEDALDVVRQQMLTAYERWQKTPESAEHNGHLGMLLSAYDKNATSEIFFRRARIFAPEEFRWTYYLAIAIQQQGRYEEAAGLFEDALTIDRNSIEARMRLAGVLFQINENEKSVALYEAITTELPDNIEGWLGLGKALERSGNFEPAIAALKRARGMGPQFGDVRYALATALSANGDRDGAAREFTAYENRKRNKINTSDRYVRKVIQLNASDGPFLAKADYQIANGNYAAAVEFFRSALEINPVNQDAWGGLVFSQGKLGDVEATGASYREALAAGIAYKRLHYTYGQALRKWQQFDAARDVMAEALELDPRYSEALIAMGELELQRGAHAAAAEQYRRLVAVQPNDRKLRLTLAQTLNLAGEFAQAVTQLEPLSTDKDADKGLALKELAVAYHGLKRNKEAIDALQRGREAAAENYDTALVETIDALLAKW